LFSGTANNGGLSASTMNIPAGVAVDGSGNLYVADRGNNRVLRFANAATAATGAAATVALGQPNLTSGTVNNGGISASTMNQPRGMAVDGLGNLYVVDYLNHRVLRFASAATAATGAAATIALGQPDLTSGAANNGGLSASTMNGPFGVAVDGSGNLYVADQGNNRVLRFNNIATQPASATRLRFINAVVSARQNIDLPAIIIDAQRADASRDSAFTGSVTVSLVGSGTLTGTLTRAAVLGRATFDNLRISAAGNFRLVAASGALSADTSTAFGVLTVQRDPTAGVPNEFALEQNYPNPFNPSTIISYQLPINSEVRLVIYDMLGREVQTLVNTRQAAGRYSASFNAASLVSGVYFYRLQAGTFGETKKMMLIK
jgi:hypothetical protein